MNFLAQIGLILFGNKTMTKNINVLLGEYNLAPYEFKASTNALGAVNPVLFGYILKSNETQEILPGIITNWKFDHKNKYTLTLGEAKFHNGRTVKATDFEFSIIRGFISKNENYNKILFSDIEGTENLKIGSIYKPGMLSGIKVTNEKTVEITVKNNNPIFLLNFTIPFAPIVPIEELEDDLYTWKKTPIGAGPYQIVNDYKDHVLKLQRVDDRLNIPKSIEYHTQRKNTEYDIIFDVADINESELNFKKWYSKYPSMITSLFFFRKNKLAKNINFRKAIHHAIDRIKCVDDSILHTPAFEMRVNPNKIDSKAINPYDIELAKDYAKKLPNEYFEEEIKVAVFSSTNEISPIIKKQVKLITESLSPLGLKIKFEASQAKFPTDEVMNNFTMKLVSKVVDLGDPSISYGAMSKNSPYNNEIPDSDGRFDKAYEKALGSETFEERLKNIEIISKTIEKDALISPIFFRYTLFRTNPKTIKSLGDQSKPLFIDLSLVEMQ